MLIAYKFRLYLNEKQKETFSKYFGCSRVVWNKALELRESYYKEHKNDKAKEGLNYYDTARFLRELKQKEEYKWLKEANSQSLQQTLMDLDKAFKAFFKGISKYPNYKRKSNKQSFRVPQFFNFTTLDRDINAAINIRNFGLKQIGLNQIPSDRGEFKPVEAPLTAELAKMKIRARSTSHDLKTQELYVMRKLRLPIGAGSP